MNTEDYSKRNEAVYDNAASYYIQKGKDPENEKLARSIILPFASEIESRFGSDARVLEIGPGSGLMLKILGESGFNLSAIDISQKMIDASRLSCPDCNFMKGDFPQYDFGDRTYQGIFARAVIHLFSREDAILFLKKARNLLEPYGVMHACTSLHESSQEGYFEKPPINEKRFRRFWEEQDLLEAVKSSGLKVFRKTYYPSNQDREGINLLLEK